MSLRRSALWSLASQYASFVFQFASSVIISRYFLQPADVGLFSIALAAAMMVSIFQDLGISRFITGQPEMQHARIREYAAVAVGTGWLIAGIVALAAHPLALYYDEPGLTRLMLIIAASYLLLPFATVPAALLTRAMNFRALFFANAGSAFAAGAGGIALAAAGGGPASLAWGMLIGTATRLGVVMTVRPVVPGLPPDTAALRPMLGFGGSSFVLCLSGAVGMRSQDLIVGRVLGVYATGIFTRASTLAGQLSTLVVGAINSVFYPAFARKRDAGEDLAGPYLHLIACNTGLNWAAMAGLAIAAEPLVHLLYGPRWAEVGPMLRWTAIAEILFFAVPLQMDIPILLGRIRSLVWINLVDTAITIGLLALIATWGLEAAAVSRILAAALWVAIYISFIGRLLALDWRALMGIYLRSALCAAAAAAPMGLALHGQWFGPAPGILPLILLSGLGVATWLGAVILVQHPLRSELRLFASAVAALRPVQAAR